MNGGLGGDGRSIRFAVRKGKRVSARGGGEITTPTRENRSERELSIL